MNLFKHLKIGRKILRKSLNLSQISSKTSRGNTIKDITSDSQMNSHFPYSWSHRTSILAYFLYLYQTRKTKHNHKPHLKPPRTKTKAAFGTASNNTGPSPTLEKWAGHISPGAECKRGGKSRILVVVMGGGGGWWLWWADVSSPENYFRFQKSAGMVYCI